MTDELEVLLEDFVVEDTELTKLDEDVATEVAKPEVLEAFEADAAALVDERLALADADELFAAMVDAL